MKRFAIVCLSIMALLGCAESVDELNRLAAQGQIQQDAPVKAEAEITIDAPSAKIMGLLMDVGGWPRWQPDIDKASMLGKPAVGAQFVWSTGGMNVHSTIRLLDPRQALCWTGRMLHIHAIHCWALSTLSDHRVLVTTRESMDGLLISHMYSSAELLESDRHWLEKLKKAAE